MADGGIKPSPVRRGMPAAGYNTPLSPSEAVAYAQWRDTLPENLRSTRDYDLQGAYLDNLQPDRRNHMGDFRKKPNHMTFSTQSTYSTPQAPGGRWVEGAGAGAPGFWASPTNLQYNSLPDLARYMRQVEPDVTFVAPIDYRLPPGGRR